MSSEDRDQRRAQLLETVGLLAAAADKQLSWLIAMGADPSELVAQYEDASLTWLPALLPELSVDARHRLAALSRELDRLKTDPELASFSTPDDALRQAEAWDRVRTVAAAALVSIDR